MPSTYALTLEVEALTKKSVVINGTATEASVFQVQVPGAATAGATPTYLDLKTLGLVVSPKLIAIAGAPGITFKLGVDADAIALMTIPLHADTIAVISESVDAPTNTYSGIAFANSRTQAQTVTVMVCE